MDGMSEVYEALSDFDKGWICGLLDGEGSFYGSPNSSKYIIDLSMCDLDTVLRYYGLLQVTTKLMELPSKHLTTAGNPCETQFRVKINGQKAKAVMKSIFPHMSGRRQLRIQKLFLDEGL